MSQTLSIGTGEKRARRGSVLVIVLWICLGLVTLTLYFAHEVNSEAQAAANRVGDVEARQAVEGAIRYAAYILNNYAIDGVVPNSGIPPEQIQDYYSSALRVGDQAGDPLFWYIGRDPNDTSTPPLTQPVFSLVDESSKLNLNTATATMLENLPPLTNATADATSAATLAQAIVSWRTRTTQANAGAVSNLYSTLDPGRVNKGAVFESTDELRQVYGATLGLILGEDTNRNGILDPNEDDGDQSPPHDNQDGILQPGLLEYVTAFSSLPTTTTTGSARVNISTPTGLARLAAQMTRKGIAQGNATRYIRNLGGTPCTSVAQFMVRSRISAADFALIHTSITTAATATTLQGMVNVNTASEDVLACIPGITPDLAAQIVAYRVANPQALTSFAWLTSVPIPSALLTRIGPYITDQSYQFSADITAVGRNGRGYCREYVVFDTSMSIPRIIYREDRSAYGWALGTQVRQDLKNARNN